MENKTPNIAYRYWQDRAIPFYLAARILCGNSLTGEASAFCAYQAIENIIKAALEFRSEVWDKKQEGHNLKKLTKLLKKHSIVIKIPDYFDDFQIVTRYPVSGRNNKRDSGLYIPDFLNDLDESMYKIISQVPDIGKTRLWHLLKKNAKDIPELSQNNRYFLKLRLFYFPENSQEF